MLHTMLSDSVDKTVKQALVDDFSRVVARRGAADLRPRQGEREDAG